MVNQAYGPDITTTPCFQPRYLWQHSRDKNISNPPLYKHNMERFQKRDAHPSTKTLRTVKLNETGTLTSVKYKINQNLEECNSIDFGGPDFLKL